MSIFKAVSPLKPTTSQSKAILFLHRIPCLRSKCSEENSLELELRVKGNGKKCKNF